MRTEWNCARCGAVVPLHRYEHISAEILDAVARAVGPAGARTRAAGGASAVPLWCPWPLLAGWVVTGVAWAGDDRGGARATALAISGPAPFTGGPADVVFVAEQPGVGLGTSLAGISGPDPGPALRDAVETTAAHAKVKASGHPTPLWAVRSGAGRSAYVGEARGMWLYAIAWPAQAGYVLAEEIQLHDLTDSRPSELVFGAPTRRLRPAAVEE